ncbi:MULTISPECIES: type II toxin-antitoxin system RelE/ParE family toxin [unclassified Novosphingobium]|uniref:type II toxin-antitoxin system RelE/ParE family toxin n=1 Tax=unclassified Novosphingobium TaxID=2644732 RepID=UPI001356EF78|nr:MULTISPECIES: type II toxin-antitoxin system RelE/ParE family toxin [unclassified Novosphingobium]
MTALLTPAARAELRTIALDIARGNPPRALSFVVELGEVVARLAEMPQAFPLVPRYEARGIRRRSWRGYGLLYAAAESGGIVLHRILGPGQGHDRALHLS